MKRSACALFAMVTLTGLLSACTVTTTTTPTNTAAPTNTAPKPAPAATNTAPPTNTTAAAPAGQESNLVVTNKSKWAVHQMFLSPANDNEWGPDQLAAGTIEPGAKFTLNKIPCDTYDIKIVDEDGDECIVKGEKFCGNEVTWDLTDEELLGCEGYGEE